MKTFFSKAPIAVGLACGAPLMLLGCSSATGASLPDNAVIQYDMESVPVIQDPPDHTWYTVTKDGIAKHLKTGYGAGEVVGVSPISTEEWENLKTEFSQLPSEVMGEQPGFVCVGSGRPNITVTVGDTILADGDAACGGEEETGRLEILKEWVGPLVDRASF